MSTLYEAAWTAARRKAHKAKGGYFAGPGDSFPLDDASDVADAWGLAGHAANPDQVRANIKRWAKDNGHYDALPDTAKADDGKKQESAATVQSSVVRPRAKIATLRVCFLEYNARSLNGRIYPKATCDRIYASSVRKLADPNALPMTCFVSHEAANGNVNTELVGAPRRIWQEGPKFWADIDLADTRTAWDMLGLCEGGYMRSESMRVVGVELLHDRNYDLPLVVVSEGVEPELLGIDLTTRPGLTDTARIQQVLYESADWQQLPYTEAFSIDAVLIQSKEEAPMSHIPLFLRVILQEGMTSDRQAHQKIHDHLAGVLDATVTPKHGSESARLMAAVESELSEEGKAIARQHAVKIAAAHDVAAHTLGMDCEGAYNPELNIPDAPSAADVSNPDQPDDPPVDGGESHTKGAKPLTEAEMIAALKAKGYTGIEPPKSQADEIAELRRLITEQEQKLKTMTESAPPPQRQTQALGSGLTEGGLQPEELYEDGDYMRGTLAPTNWKALANRRVPWPQDMDPQMALHELAPFLAYRLLDQEANAMGRDIASYVDPRERI